VRKASPGTLSLNAQPVGCATPETRTDVHFRTLDSLDVRDVDECVLLVKQNSYRVKADLRQPWTVSRRFQKPRSCGRSEPHPLFRAGPPELAPVHARPMRSHVTRLHLREDQHHLVRNYQVYLAEGRSLVSRDQPQADALHVAKRVVFAAAAELAARINGPKVIACSAHVSTIRAPWEAMRRLGQVGAKSLYLRQRSLTYRFPLRRRMILSHAGFPTTMAGLSTGYEVARVGGPVEVRLVDSFRIRLPVLRAGAGFAWARIPWGVVS
jgi:hypothetical protein